MDFKGKCFSCLGRKNQESALGQFQRSGPLPGFGTVGAACGYPGLRGTVLWVRLIRTGDQHILPQKQPPDMPDIFGGKLTVSLPGIQADGGHGGGGLSGKGAGIHDPAGKEYIPVYPDDTSGKEQVGDGFIEKASQRDLVDRHGDLDTIVLPGVVNAAGGVGIHVPAPVEGTVRKWTPG